MQTNEKIGKKKFETYDSFATIKLTIETKGPLLIKSGDTGLTPSNKDMRFIRDPSGDIFIPGSSLKGFFRGNLERMENHINSKIIEYVFGSKDPSNSYASSIYFNDLYPEKQTVKFESRSQTAIDRKTMGVKGGALMFIECLSKGAIFHGSIHIRNFNIEQLGLLQAIIQFTNKSHLRLGFNKTRGYGEIRIQIDEIEIESFSEQIFKCTKKGATIELSGSILDKDKGKSSQKIQIKSDDDTEFQEIKELLGVRYQFRNEYANDLLKKSMKYLLK